jgi:hypothetical protein
MWGKWIAMEILPSKLSPFTENNYQSASSGLKSKTLSDKRERHHPALAPSAPLQLRDSSEAATFKWDSKISSLQYSNQALAGNCVGQGAADCRELRGVQRVDIRVAITSTG